MSETSAPIWLKVMAVLTATALGGGYVAYRKASADKANQSPPPAQQAAAENAPPEETPAEDRTVMSGSKSGAATIDEPVLREIMSSSKSAIIIPLEQPKQESDRPLLSGSKSALVFPPEEEQPEYPEKKQRTLLPGSKSIIDPAFRKEPLPEEP